MTEAWGPWWDRALVQAWAMTLLHFCWQGLLVAAVCHVHLRLVQDHPARARYGYALGWLAILTAVPLFTFALLVNAASRPEQTERVPPPRLGDPWRLDALEWEPPAEPTANDRNDTRKAIEGSATSADRWEPYLLLGWLSGVVALSLRLLGGGCTLLWLRRTAEPLPEPWRAPVARLRRRLRTPARVVVAVSCRLTSAIACGVVRPMVIIPASWLLDLSPAMLQAVIAHELCHVRRYDLWVNGCQRIVETVWFYHPAVWWISAVVRREREMCCDEMAVAATECRVEYARTLEYLAARRWSGTAPQGLSAGMGEERMQLLQRVKHVLGTRDVRRAGSAWPVVVTLLSLALAAGILSRNSGSAVASEQAPQEESDDGVEAKDLKQSLAHEAEVQQLRAQLERSTAQLRKYEGALDRLVAEFARTRAKLEVQERSLATLRAALAATPATPPASTEDTPAERPDASEAARLDIERELVAHRRHSLEARIEQVRKQSREDVQIALDSELQQQSRQLEYQRQLAALESERADLDHDRRVREIQMQMEQVAVQRKRTSEGELQEAMDHQLAALKSELDSIESQRALDRKFREVEIQAKEHAISPETIQRRVEAAAAKELQAQVASLEAQLEELKLEQKRLELERARLKD